MSDSSTTTAAQGVTVEIQIDNEDVRVSLITIPPGCTYYPERNHYAYVETAHTYGVYLAETTRKKSMMHMNPRKSVYRQVSPRSITNQGCEPMVYTVTEPK